MSTRLESVELNVFTDEASIRRAADRIRAAVWLAGFIRPAGESRSGVEQRREPRQPFVIGTFLMPVNSDGDGVSQVDPDEPLLPVITFDISPHGVSIQHDRPLQSTTCLLAFDLWTDRPVTLLVEQRWTRLESGSPFAHRSGFEILGVAREGVRGNVELTLRSVLG